VGFFDFFKGKGGRKKKAKVDLKRRFELQTRSGQGSMSKVWRAYDREVGRVVCLKILDKVKTARFEARFVGRNKPPEGEICMALKHPNIVKTYDYGTTTQGEPFMSMEWIEGAGLNFLIETRSPRLKDKSIDYLCQVCDAVEYMHKERYLHRDLCPRNVMVTNDDVVKLIDFGLTIPYTPAFCEPGNRTGTPDYLAPEIIKRQTTDHKVDLFALGVTAFELFTGGLPWEKAQGSMEMLVKHINSRPRDPREFRRDMDEELVAILNKAIEREPAKRFQSARHFKAALQDYAGVAQHEE
jgi:eukaryotic-like serine/threonine-protein kinase